MPTTPTHFACAYRHIVVDATRPCDVVEEILRVYGYNNVEFGTEMHANLSPAGDTDLSYSLQQLVSNRLTGEGFLEILNKFALGHILLREIRNSFPFTLREGDEPS